jgi:hypothetical protein
MTEWVLRRSGLSDKTREPIILARRSSHAAADRFQKGSAVVSLKSFAQIGHPYLLRGAH